MQRQPSSAISRARELRQQMSEPELKLWRALREAFPDARFRRQAPFGRYHADFCSHGRKLVIEVDGKPLSVQVGMNMTVVGSKEAER